MWALIVIYFCHFAPTDYLSYLVLPPYQVKTGRPVRKALVNLAGEPVQDTGVGPRGMGGVEEPNYKDFSEYFLPSLTIPHVPSPCVYVRIVVQEVWLVGVFQGFLEGRLLVGPIYPQLIPQAAGKR